jgi:hypothetical protein
MPAEKGVNPAGVFDDIGKYLLKTRLFVVPCIYVYIQ